MVVISEFMLKIANALLRDRVVMHDLAMISRHLRSVRRSLANPFPPLLVLDDFYGTS